MNYKVLLFSVTCLICCGTSCSNEVYFSIDEVRIAQFPIVKTLTKSYEELDLDIVGVQGIKVIDSLVLVSTIGDSDGCLLYVVESETENIVRYDIADVMNEIFSMK